jgi:hypothetical protein
MAGVCDSVVKYCNCCVFIVINKSPTFDAVFSFVEAPHRVYPLLYPKTANTNVISCIIAFSS